MFWIYIIINFIIFYIAVKKWGKALTANNFWMDIKEFWYILAVTLFWPLVIPGYIMWRILDRITNKFFKS